MQRHLALKLASLAALILVTACGGGDKNYDGSVAAPASPATAPSAPGAPGAVTRNSAEGFYVGDLMGGRAFKVIALVTPSSEAYVLFGTLTNGFFSASGLVQGVGQSSNGNFATNAAISFTPSGNSTARVVGTYAATGSQLVGSLSTPSSTSQFDLSFPVTQRYAFRNPASLSDYVGGWNLFAQDGSGVQVSFNADGSFTGSQTGCNFTGRATPALSGRNYLTLDISFRSPSCPTPNGTAQGIAVAYDLDRTNNALVFAFVDADKRLGVGAYGVKVAAAQ